MENPRMVGWLWGGFICFLAALMAILSVIHDDYRILLWGILGVLGLFVAASLVNVSVFAPILWLMSKLSSSPRAKKRE